MKRICMIIINLFVGIMSYGAWMGMALINEGTLLSSQGLVSLKYFTVLSNLLNGIVCLYYAGKLIAGKKITFKDQILKLVSTAAVGLTFTTVVVFLGPLYGFLAMFQGANFWLHLVLPVASILSYMFLEQDRRIPLRYTLFAVIPTALYAAGYLINIGINGIGKWPDTNDFYGFFNWGYKVGAVIAVVILLVTWGLALVFCGVGNIRNKKSVVK